MKCTLCLAAIISVALAMAVQEQGHVKRSDVQNAVPASQAAMTDASGNVIPFDAKNVYLAGVAGGL